MTQYIMRRPRMAALKVERAQKDADLAAALKVAVNTMRLYIAGKPMTYPAAKVLAEHLDVEMSDLFEERTVPPPQPRAHRGVAAAEEGLRAERTAQGLVDSCGLPGGQKRAARRAS